SSDVVEASQRTQNFELFLLPVDKFGILEGCQKGTFVYTLTGLHMDAGHFALDNCAHASFVLWWQFQFVIDFQRSLEVFVFKGSHCQSHFLDLCFCQHYFVTWGFIVSMSILNIVRVSVFMRMLVPTTRQQKNT